MQKILGRALFTSISLVALFLHGGSSYGRQSQEGVPPPLPEGNQGIAAGYPGDAGIARDPRVVFVDDFESGSTKADNAWGAIVYTKKPEHVHGGTCAMELTLPWP